MREIIDELFERVKGKSPEELLQELNMDEMEKLVYLTYIGQKLLEMRDMVRKGLIDQKENGTYPVADIGRIVVYTQERHLFNPEVVFAELQKLGQENRFKDAVDVSASKLKNLAQDLKLGIEVFKPEKKEVKTFRVEVYTEMDLKLAKGKSQKLKG